MKHVISFQLPEEKEDLESAMNGWKYKIILETVFSKLRHKSKYENKETMKIDDIRKMIVEIQDEYLRDE